MTGDPTRDHEATSHDFAAPDVPWDDNDYTAARAQREAEQKARMDAAHEKAKAERCHHCHDDPPRGHVCPACGTRAAREGSQE